MYSTKPKKEQTIRQIQTYLLVICLTGVSFYPETARSDVPVVPSGQVFECTPTHVWDGDGPIWCREGPRLRLAGIAARELNGSCSPGHPCPASDGEIARAALVALLGKPTGVGRHGHILVAGPTLRCRSVGSAGGNRTASWCISPSNGDVNCAMVIGGWAAIWDRFWNNHQC